MASFGATASLHRLWLWTILAYYLGVIGALSHMPGQAISELGFDFWDKAAHFAAYFPIGIAAWLAVRDVPRLSSWTWLLLFVALGSGLLGAMDELHQSFVPGRFCTVSDGVADVLGASIGAVFAKGAGMVVSRWRS